MTRKTKIRKARIWKIKRRKTKIRKQREERQ